MAFDFNKAQDAIVEFLKGLQLRLTSVFARSGAAADEVGQTADAAEKSIQTLTPEVKQALDALEKIGPVCDSMKATVDAFGKTAEEVQACVADVRAFLADLRAGKIELETKTKVQKATRP